MFLSFCVSSMCELLSLTDVLLLFVRVRNAHMMFSYYSESAEPSILVILKKARSPRSLSFWKHKSIDPRHSGKQNSRSLPFWKTEFSILTIWEHWTPDHKHIGIHSSCRSENVVFSNPTVWKQRTPDLRHCELVVHISHHFESTQFSMPASLKAQYFALRFRPGIQSERVGQIPRAWSRRTVVDFFNAKTCEWCVAWRVLWMYVVRISQPGIQPCCL